MTATTVTIREVDDTAMIRAGACESRYPALELFPDSKIPFTYAGYRRLRRRGFSGDTLTFYICTIAGHKVTREALTLMGYGPEGIGRRHRLYMDAYERKDSAWRAVGTRRSDAIYIDRGCSSLKNYWLTMPIHSRQEAGYFVYRVAATQGESGNEALERFYRDLACCIFGLCNPDEGTTSPYLMEEERP